MPEEFGDKTHDPTPHRRQKAREEGQVVKSTDLSSAGLLLGGLLIMYGLSAGLFEFLGGLTATQLGNVPQLNFGTQDAINQSHSLIEQFLDAMLPILGLLMGLAIVLNIGQTGFLFTPKRIAFDLSRISPLKGAQRIFSLAGIARLGFGLFKMLIVGGVAFLSLYGRRGELLLLPEWSASKVGVFLLDIVFWTTVKIAIALFVLSFLEYAFQRWKHTRDLRMTTQELKDEFKNLQGDPHIAARRKVVQRQLVLNRLQQDVAEADVVTTNPTHLAVALKYDPETMLAPIVVAKGKGVIAERIRKIALENEIPVLERKPLTQALYHNVEINQPIPFEQYAAVAEILRYVYELKGKTMPKL